MASRSMFGVSNHFDISDMSKNNLEGYFVHNSGFVLNNLMNSFDCNYSLSFSSQIIDVKDTVVENLSKFFMLIDLGSFLINLFKKEEMMNISTSRFSSRNQANYHKIKHIDNIKCLALVKQRIELLIQNDLSDAFVFAQEVQKRYGEFDTILRDNLLLQIDEATEKFSITYSMVDTMLEDCLVDLLDLEKLMVETLIDWEKKRLRGKKSGNRCERLSNKIINSLKCDILVQLHTLNVILDRILYGYSPNILNINHSNFAQDILLEFRSEIDERQYQNIVFLKHFRLELEQKTLIRILEMEENIMAINAECGDGVEMFQCQLSPIKSSTNCRKQETIKKVAMSTPYVNQRLHQKRTDHIDSFSECEEQSILSQDSGILPTSECNLVFAESLETLDVIPFPEEEYEKITDYNCEKEGLPLKEDSDCFGSMSTDSEREPFSSESLICFTDDNIDSPSSQNVSTSNLNIFDQRQEFENYNIIVDSLTISSLEKQKMKNQMKILLANRITNNKFNSALKMTFYKSKENSFNDLAAFLQHLEEVFFSFMHIDIREMDTKGRWTINVDNQDNNSAHCPSFVSHFNSDFSTQNDQNTNNNADAKEDESNDPNCSPNDLIHKLSICASTDIHLVSVNSLSDSPSTEGTDHDQVSINSEASDSHFLENGVEEDLHDVEGLSSGSLILEDIDLALRLSELHLRSEYSCELRAQDVLIETRNKVVQNFKAVEDDARNRIVEIKAENCDLSKDEWKDYVNQMYDTIDDVNDDTSSEALLEVSVDRSEISDCISLPKDNEHDDETMSNSQRISLTISLTERLLYITTRRLHFISSLLKNKDICKKPKILTNRMFSIYSMRQRLNVITSITSNLKFSITCASNTDESSEFILELDKIITDSSNLTKFSYHLEELFNKASLSVDEVNNDYLEQLPDDLLVSLEPCEMESILSISIQRLHITISALAHYPCYESLMKSSLKKFIINIKPMTPHKGESMSPLSNSELIREIHKLRRITAICALNIVDLHIIIARAEEKPDLEEKTSELKELLLVWRVIDKECHRLLRCNSLIQHVLMDTRRTYVELVSLTAVMLSIIRTVDLPASEESSLNEHMINVHSYKVKIIEWLNEVELCSSVIHKKRITSKRFKFYEDIHNYLEQNLKSITELANHINLGCNETVKSLSSILAYCCSLSLTQPTEIDNSFKSCSIIDNRELGRTNDERIFLNEGIMNVILQLEVTENNVFQLQDLLDQSKDLFLEIIADKSYFNQNDTVEVLSIKSAENCDREVSILDSALVKLTEKISVIASYAASKAILLFVDKSRLDDHAVADIGMDSWTVIAQNDDILDNAVEVIVDEVTAMMTALVVRNMSSRNASHELAPCRIIFNDVCEQLYSKSITFLVDNLQLDILHVAGNDITDYLSEEISHLILNNCINDMPIFEPFNVSPSCTALCVSKLQKKLSQRLFDKSVLYISDFVGANIGRDCDIEEGGLESLQDNYRDFISPIPTYRLSKKVLPELMNPEDISIVITKMIGARPISLGEYRCDVRRPMPKIPRISSDRISKLVARFDRGVLEEELPMNAPIGDIRVAKNNSKSVQILSDEVVPDVISDPIEDLSLENKTAENLSFRGYESCSSLDKIDIETATSTERKKKSYSTETRENEDFVEFGMSERPGSTDPRLICTLGREEGVSSQSRKSTHSQRLSLASESISLAAATFSGVVECQEAPCTSPRVMTTSPSVLERVYQSVEAQNYSAPINRLQLPPSVLTATDGPLGALATVTTEVGPSNLVRMDLITKTVTSDDDEAVSVPLESLWAALSSNCHNEAGDRPSLAAKATKVPIRDYEASLSRLWVGVLLAVLLVLLVTICRDLIGRACLCSDGLIPGALLPRVTTSGQPV